MLDTLEEVNSHLYEYSHESFKFAWTIDGRRIKTIMDMH